MLGGVSNKMLNCMDCDLGMRCYNNGLFSIYIHNYTHDVITGFHNVTLMPACPSFYIEVVLSSAHYIKSLLAAAAACLHYNVILAAVLF